MMMILSTLKSKPWKNEKYKNTTLYHQAGNSIVVPVLEAILNVYYQKASEEDE